MFYRNFLEKDLIDFNPRERDFELFDDDWIELIEKQICSSIKVFTLTDGCKVYSIIGQVNYEDFYSIWMISSDNIVLYNKQKDFIKCFNELYLQEKPDNDKPIKIVVDKTKPSTIKFISRYGFVPEIKLENDFMIYSTKILEAV